MMPFDGSGPPQQGQGVAPQMQMPMPPGHGQANPSPGMPPGHHQPGPPMNAPGPYGHRNSLTMPGQPPFMPPPSPARQGSFTGSMSGGSVGPPQYSGHPPLHSPHQSQGPPGPPMHPSMGHQMQQHRGSMNRHGGSSGMGPQGGMHPGMMGQSQHDPMRGSSQGSHNRQQQQPPPQQQQQQQYMGNSSANSGGGGALAGSWQSDSDTPHRREMIQQM